MEQNNNKKALRCPYLKVEVKVTCGAGPSGMEIPSLHELENYCLAQQHKNCPSFLSKNQSGKPADER